MDFFDELILAAIALLVFFSVFAFGGVDVWAVKIEEQVCFSLLLLWLVKCFVRSRNITRIWLPAQGGFGAMALPVMLLLGFVSFQLMPLRPAVLRYLSWHTFELYRTTISGWPDSLSYDNPGFSLSLRRRGTAPSPIILPTEAEVRRGAGVPFAAKSVEPPLTAGLFAARRSLGSNRGRIWMPLSMAPPLTRAALLKSAAYASLFFLVGFYPAGDDGQRAERNFRRRLVLMVLAAGTAVALVGLAQQAFWNGRILWVHVPRDWDGPMLGLQRASGPFVNPDHFANYLAIVLPLALVGTLFRIPLEKTKSFSGFQLLCAFAVLVMFAAVIASVSRAGVAEVCLGVLSVVWLLARGRRRRVSNEAVHLLRGPVALALVSAVGVFSAVALALMLIGPAQTEHVGARFAGISNGQDLADRWAMWMDSARILRDYPLFGVGLGSWPVIFPHYQRSPWSMYFAGEAQNDYVEAAVEYGIVGLLLLAWVCFAAGRILIRGSRSLETRDRPLFAALVSAIIIMSLHELLDFCLQIPANAILFVLLLALAVRLVRSNRMPTPARSRPAWLIGAAGLAFSSVAAIASANQHATVYPDDLRVPASFQECITELLSYPSSALPHMWLANLIRESSGNWPLGELQSAVWLDPNNPDYRDRYVLALLSAGRHQQALHQLSNAMFIAPHLDDHPFLNLHLLPWLPDRERLAAQTGLKAAVAQDYEGSVEALGDLYRAEGREADAAKMYDEEARREQNASLRFQYYLAAGQAYVQASRLPAAEQAFRAATSLAPDDQRPYENLITLVYGPQKNATAAERVIRAAADQGISASVLYVLFSQAASAAHDPKLAEESLLKAANYDPSYANLMMLGEFYLGRGQFDRARVTLERAIRINPHSAQAYFTLAQAEEGAYEFPAAESDYQRAVALAPDHPEFKTRLNDLIAKTKS